VVKIMTPCEIATPGKSRRSWDHRLGLIQQISLDHLVARAVITIRHMGAMDADPDFNHCQPHDPDNHASLKPITAGALHAVTIVGRSRGGNLRGHDSARYLSVITTDFFLLSKGSNPRESNL